MSIADLPKTREFIRRDAAPQRFSRPECIEQAPPAGLQSLDDLSALNFYCFAGRRDFSDKFRALVVGGGTPQSAIDLATQLQGCNATVVFAATDERVERAGETAAIRDIGDRIEWVTSPVDSLQNAGLEPFDYINCCGILENCGNPAQVLSSLQPLLKPEGALGLSFRGKYGRTGLSQMAELMRIVNHDTRETGEAVANTRAVIDRLPATNWCKRSIDLFPLYAGLSDSDVYELFLNSRHPGFSLPEVWKILDGCGLFLVEHTREQRALCEPQFAFPPGQLLEQIQKLPRRDQQAATELYWGAATQHTFWATNRPDTVAPLTDPEMIPFFTRFAARNNIQQSILDTAGEEWSWKTRLAGEVDVSITFHVAPAARRFVELIDDRRTLGEILETILAAYNPRPPIEEAIKIARYVMEVLLRQDLLLVRHPSTPRLA